jgi:hypothetical protein
MFFMFQLGQTLQICCDLAVLLNQCISTDLLSAVTALAGQPLQGLSVDLFFQHF